MISTSILSYLQTVLQRLAEDVKAADSDLSQGKRSVIRIPFTSVRSTIILFSKNDYNNNNNDNANDTSWGDLAD